MFRMFDLNGKNFFLTLLDQIKVHISRKNASNFLPPLVLYSQISFLMPRVLVIDC